MFSKLLFAVPIPSKDAITVSSALYNLFTTFGGCDTILSDQGTEFTAQVTSEVCRLMGISQQFTPSFAHHCLGACERMHRTLEERLTPYVDKQKRNWDDKLPSIVFAINQSVNSTLGYSPFEVVFGYRPRFPLSPVSLTGNLHSLPKDCQEYMASFLEKLRTIRTEVQNNIEANKETMVARTNLKSHPLNLNIGDYVYLSIPAVGPAYKLQAKFSGPYVVHTVCSDSRVMIQDQTTEKVLSEPVHVNRLKMAYVRAPSPQPYLLGPVVTRTTVSHTLSDKHTQTDTQPHREVIPELGLHDIAQEDLRPKEPKHTLPKDHSKVEHCNPPVPQESLRPRRLRRKPLRYRDLDHSDPLSAEISSMSDSGTLYKVKRVLGQRGSGNSKEYLVHFCGEPAQNSMWLPWEALNAKTQQVIKQKPPPLLS